MDDKISIYIVEDYMLARITFEKALKKYDDIEIKGSFESGEDCLEALEKERAVAYVNSTPSETSRFTRPQVSSEMLLSERSSVPSRSVA